MMEVNIARTYKRELERKIAELIKEYEKNTTISVSNVTIVRQSTFDNLGCESEFKYAVEVESKI